MLVAIGGKPERIGASRDGQIGGCGVGPVRSGDWYGLLCDHPATKSEGRLRHRHRCRFSGRIVLRCLPSGKNLVDVLVPAFSFSLLAAVGIYALRWPLIKLTDDRIRVRWFEIGRAEFARARLGSCAPPTIRRERSKTSNSVTASMHSSSWTRRERLSSLGSRPHRLAGSSGGRGERVTSRGCANALVCSTSLDVHRANTARTDRARLRHIVGCVGTWDQSVGAPGQPSAGSTSDASNSCVSGDVATTIT